MAQLHCKGLRTGHISPGSPFRAPWLGFLIAAFSAIANAQSSPFFPVVGAEAVHQRTLDLESGAVVLSVAAEPGMEDLPTLATLRLDNGAKIVSLYATNGGATPGEIRGDPVARNAAERMREAFDAITLIGGQSYFLDLADHGVVASRDRLADLWKKDSVISLLVTAIKIFQPDLILISKDFREQSGDSTRGSLLKDLLLAAVRKAGTPGGTGGQSSWRVGRVFFEDDSSSGSIHVDAEKIHPLWKTSFREIAEKARRRYASILIQTNTWNIPSVRTYISNLSDNGGKPRTFLGGLPLITKSLQPFRSMVRDVVDAVRKNKKDEALRFIVSTSASIEQYVTNRQSPERHRAERILSQWKNGMEDLRCSLLNVQVEYSPSDSLLADRQVFTLRFQSVRGDVPEGQTEILFPSAMDGTWYINGKDTYRFPFSAPCDFEIGTPEQLRWNTPASVYGLTLHVLRTNFPFIVFRKDTVGTRSFAFRSGITFDTGPARTIELLTPIVRVIEGERLVYSLQDISRDPYKAQAWVKDSVVMESRRTFAFQRKDQVVTDSLPLHWNAHLVDGDYAIQLYIGKRPVARFIARKFDARVDTSAPVGLITGMASSPLEAALQRLRVPYQLVLPDDLKNGVLQKHKVLVIDRDAFALRPEFNSGRDTIASWVSHGGHLVLLPQRPGVSLPSIGEFDFPALRLDPETAVIADSGGFTVSPNLLKKGDWSGWALARAMERADVHAGPEQSVLVRAEPSGVPLVVRSINGRGHITSVALDLQHQLEIVHPGAFRIFANLLAN